MKCSWLKSAFILVEWANLALNQDEVCRLGLWKYIRIGQATYHSPCSASQVGGLSNNRPYSRGGGGTSSYGSSRRPLEGRGSHSSSSSKPWSSGSHFGTVKQVVMDPPHVAPVAQITIPHGVAHPLNMALAIDRDRAMDIVVTAAAASETASKAAAVEVVVAKQLTTIFSKKKKRGTGGKRLAI